MAKVSDKGRLLAIGLLNLADDEGFFSANTRLIQAEIFPFEPETDVAELIKELNLRK